MATEEKNNQNRKVSALTAEFRYLEYKRMLQEPWSMWTNEPTKSKKWEESLVEVGSFCTFEDFWCIYNHMKGVSALPFGCDYYLFKQGIRPMWEDPKNTEGGRWIVDVSKSDTLDHRWLHLVMGLLNNYFEENHQYLNGVTVSVRKNMNRLALWTCNAKDEHNVISIGMMLKEMMRCPPTMIISYQAHSSSNSKDRQRQLLYYI